jgi:hypothetical protein
MQRISREAVRISRISNATLCGRTILADAQWPIYPVWSVCSIEKAINRSNALVIKAYVGISGCAFLDGVSTSCSGATRKHILLEEYAYLCRGGGSYAKRSAALRR